jgi:hypothetical protein
MKSGFAVARAIIGLTLVYLIVMPLVAIAVTAGYVAFRIGGSD